MPEQIAQTQVADLQSPLEEYYPAFKAPLVAQGTDFPGHVQQKFEEYLECGRLEHGFLRVRCDTCHAERRVAFCCKRRVFCPSCGDDLRGLRALSADERAIRTPRGQWVHRPCCGGAGLNRMAARR